MLALTVNNTRQSPAQPHSVYALERLYVADAGFRERVQFELDLRTRRGGELAPLADGGRRELDLFRIPTIA